MRAWRGPKDLRVARTLENTLFLLVFGGLQEQVSNFLSQKPNARHDSSTPPPPPVIMTASIMTGRFWTNFMIVHDVVIDFFSILLTIMMLGQQDAQILGFLK